MHDTKCKICGEGICVEKNEVENFTHNNITKPIVLKGYECNNCYSSFSTPAQAKANKRAVIAFRREADELLSASEVRLVRETLGITQVESSRYFGGGPIAFSKYESDDVAQSSSMDTLLRVAYAVPGVMAFLKARAEGSYKSLECLPFSEPKSHVNIARSHQLYFLFMKNNENSNVWHHQELLTANCNNLFISRCKEVAQYAASIGTLSKKIVGYTSLEKLIEVNSTDVEDDEIKGYQFSGNYSSSSQTWNKNQCRH